MLRQPFPRQANNKQVKSICFVAESAKAVSAFLFNDCFFILKKVL